MSKPIRRVAVLGAGVMGSGIAAHVANAGLPVLLLDIVPPNISDEDRKSRAKRNAFADGAMKKMLKGKPAPFFHSDNAKLITTGNFDDDLDKVEEADLVIEAIIERLDIKRGMFDKLEKITEGTDTIVASNTSGLRIKDMLEGRSEAFRKRFMVTHFFNPPRYMKLLELVRAPETDDEVATRLETFGRDVLGKGIVYAKDTPNFVGNRIGAHSLMATIHLMLEMDLTPEDVDAITGLPMGHPKSATFRTADVVGLDTLIHVVDNCHASLTDDEDRAVFEVPDYIRTMVEKKLLGSKTKAGFYRKTKAGIETLDPKTGEYRPKGGDKAIKSKCKSLAGEENVNKRVKKLIETEGVVGEFAWKTTARSLAYAARRVGEISDDISAIDDAMRWGYNWELGPFELWDALGFKETVERMQKDGIELPESITKMKAAGVTAFYGEGGKVYDLQKGDYVTKKADPRTITLLQARTGKSPVLSNNGAEAWDVGDGILCLTYKSKANTLDPDNIPLIIEAVDKAEREFRGMLIFNQGDHFAVGANLFLVAGAAAQKQWDQLHDLINKLQTAVQRLRYSTVPVVAAPYGMTVGGGLEVCLGSDSVQAALETYAGQVEVGVGVVPAGGGCKNLVWRALEGVPEGAEVDTYALVTQVFKNIAMADVATSAHMAMEKGYFRRTDGVTFDRARHFYDAKTRVIAMAETGYHPPKPKAHKLPGESGIATLQMLINTLVAGGYATEHDGLIASKLANVLCGGVDGAAAPVTEERMLELEREAFVSLCGEEKSQQRMQYMVMNNKPLRN